MKIIEFRQSFYQQMGAIYPETEIAGIYGLLLEFYTGMSRVDAALQADKHLSDKELLSLKAALARLLNQEPIQYVLEEAVFYDLKLRVTPATLIPRPETEELVSWILSDWQHTNQSIRAVDLGTGSGCISLALKNNLATLDITAVDVSLEALEVVAYNAKHLNLPIGLLQLDILEDTLPQKDLQFIVSNPPYVCTSERELMRSNVLEYEPDLALFVEDTDPLVFYRRILELANVSVVQDGFVYFEINERFAKELTAIAKQLGWGKLSLRKDMFGRDRMMKFSR